MAGAGSNGWPGFFAGPSRGAELPVAWLLAALAIFAAGRLERLALSYSERTTTLKDTYYLIAQDHYVLRIAVMFAVFGAIYYAFPRLTGYAVSRLLGWTHFVLTFASVCLGFGTVIAVQMAISPRHLDHAAGIFAFASKVSSIGVYLTLAGLAVFAITIVEALLRKRPRTAFQQTDRGKP